MRVDRLGGRDDAAQPADDEQADEHAGVDHRDGQVQRAAPERAEPVERLNAAGHGDEHRRDGEAGAQRGVHAALKHVVSPDDEAEHRDQQRGVHHGPVAEQRLAAERRQDVADHPERRQDHDVHGRVAVEPEQVRVEQRVPAAGVVLDLVAQHPPGRLEEAGPAVVLHQVHRQQPGQHRRGEQHQQADDQQVPHRHRQPEEGQPRAPHLEDRRNVVDGPEAAAGADHDQGREPTRLPVERQVLQAANCQRGGEQGDDGRGDGPTGRVQGDEAEQQRERDEVGRDRERGPGGVVDLQQRHQPAGGVDRA